ncbi:MAG: phosphoribosylamine--glycine ligase [Bacteroidales bacterium]|nr:phosphoribosylamine--glycine ligase [Bacteroidales bacterium]
MNILVLGSGGREHSIVWKLSRSRKVNRVYTGPGNAGTAALGINLPLDPGDFEAVKKAVIDNAINMVIVGPEAPLVDGIHDFFTADESIRHIPLIGPDRSAARLEGSKDFAKSFLTRHNIPTAAFKSFDISTLAEVPGFLQTLTPPYVIKADGLAAGKGVLIIDDVLTAEQEVREILNGKFGKAGNKVVVEQFLKGVELSVFIVSDGNTYKLLPEAKDYKRIGRGDTGLNTGGMGAVSPVPFADRTFMNKVITSIIEPTVKGLKDDGIVYKGFIFFGLINVDGNPYVIEYNARLGDPESEVILPRIKSDFLDLLEGIAQGNLEEKEIETDERFFTTVMIASGGYPGHYEKGMKISGLDETKDCVIFHAGTKLTGDQVVTSGGRVLAVTSWGNTMQEALEGSYRNIPLISFDNMYFREDIGFDLKNY